MSRIRLPDGEDSAASIKPPNYFVTSPGKSVRFAGGEVLYMNRKARRANKIYGRGK